MRSAAWSAALGTGALLALAARAYGRRRRAARDAAGPPPRHVAIIMDGNRRFGARAFGPERRLEGHAAGARKLGEVVDWCLGRGVAELTVFAFSTENWDRDAGEVAALMREFVARAAEVERRLSNFLLWQAAYAELVFVEKHWPAFAERDLDAALDEYRRRGRRFGR